MRLSRKDSRSLFENDVIGIMASDDVGTIGEIIQLDSDYGMGVNVQIIGMVKCTASQLEDVSRVFRSSNFINPGAVSGELVDIVFVKLINR